LHAAPVHQSLIETGLEERPIPSAKSKSEERDQ